MTVDECKRQVLACVRSCGQDLELTDEERTSLEAERPWWVERREQLLMGASGTLLCLGLVAELLLKPLPVAIPLYVLAAVTGLVFIAPMALASLRRRTADMNVLMGIAVIGGLVMGFLGDTEVFRDAAIVIFLDQVGEWLEGWSMRKTSGSIRELMDLTPDVAHLVDELGYATDVDVKLVEEGQRIRILPGERVPLDGVILSGSSSFNEAPVTGESIPQDKGVGQEVYAGSLNANAVVDIEVTADEDCTTIARIISLVQGAQAEKAPYEGFVDRFAAAYTPVVVAGALVVGIVVPLVASLATGFSGALWHDWVYRALSLLVVACPCALVISTPVSFVSALTRAAKSGVLVKGGAYFDVATKVTTVAFDKTGTLTTGRPQVSEVVCFNGATERDVLQIARTLEEASTHPLARAVVDRAVDLGIPAARPEQVEEVASNGMCATVNGVTYVVGKLAFARSHARVSRRVAEVVERLGAQGASALVVCGGGRVAGVIGVADTMRPGAAFAMQDLAQTGVAQTVMLTGDNAHAAAAIAGQAGVSTYAAELLPADKVEHLKGLQQGGQVVAMVGDGINDAPALATADLGITMGAAASDTALEVADVALLSDDLSQLPAFFRLARKPSASRCWCSCWWCWAWQAWVPRSSPTPAWPCWSSSTACDSCWTPRRSGEPSIVAGLREGASPRVAPPPFVCVTPPREVGGRVRSRTTSATVRAMRVAKPPLAPACDPAQTRCAQASPTRSPTIAAVRLFRMPMPSPPTRFCGTEGYAWRVAPGYVPGWRVVAWRVTARAKALVAYAT